MALDQIDIPADLYGPLTGSRVGIQLGGIKLLAEAADDRIVVGVPWPWSRFDSPDAVEPDVSVTVEYSRHSGMDIGPLVYDSNQVWHLHEDGAGGHQLVLASADFGPEPFRILHFDKSFSHGRLWVRELDEWKTVAPDGVRPMIFPWLLVDEMIVSRHLLEHGDLEIHGCGVVDGPSGRLFVGHSGSGKSTMAGLWRSSGSVVLSDERCILTHAGRWTIHGTPWISDSGCFSPSEVPLAGVYFLAHGPKTEVREIEPIEAALRLVPECVSPIHSGPYLSVLLQSTAALLEQVPAYLLTFTPDMSAIEAVRRAG